MSVIRGVHASASLKQFSSIYNFPISPSVIRGVHASASLKLGACTRHIFVNGSVIRGVHASASLKPGIGAPCRRRWAAGYPRRTRLGLIEAGEDMMRVAAVVMVIRGVHASASWKHRNIRNARQ